MLPVDVEDHAVVADPQSIRADLQIGETLGELHRLPLLKEKRELLKKPPPHRGIEPTQIAHRARGEYHPHTSRATPQKLFEPDDVAAGCFLAGTHDALAEIL